MTARELPVEPSTSIPEHLQNRHQAPDHGNCPKCGQPLTTIDGFWKCFATPHCMPCLLDTREQS